MRRKLIPYFTVTILLIFVLASQFKAKRATATPPYDNKKFGSIHLSYEDTTTEEFRLLVKKLDSFYKTEVAKGFNGSVLLGYQGKVLYERYYGYANKSQGTTLKPNTGVQLASTSKTFTATAVLYLHQHKYLNIYDKVKDYIPSFPYDNVTVWMLLNHRSGLPDYLHFVPSYKKDTRTMISNEDVMDMMVKHKPRLMFTPNTRFKYCNTNYVVLARIVEEVTEMAFPEFMRNYFFEPLGMNSTYVFDASWGLPNSASVSYRAGWVPYPNMFADGVYGDKNIYSTVRDMYRWDQSFYNHTFLNEETLQLAYGPCSFEQAGIKNYGLGWRMYCYTDGDKIVFHNGWWHGNNTLFLRFINDNFTIIVLGNKYNTNIYRQGPKVYSLVNNSPVSDDFETEEEGNDGLDGLGGSE